MMFNTVSEIKSRYNLDILNQFITSYIQMIKKKEKGIIDHEPDVDNSTHGQHHFLYIPIF